MCAGIALHVEEGLKGRGDHDDEHDYSYVEELYEKLEYISHRIDEVEERFHEMEERLEE